MKVTRIDAEAIWKSMSVDFSVKDIAYWRSLHKRIHALVQPCARAHAIVKLTKQERYLWRCPEWDWSTAYTPKQVRFIRVQLDLLMIGCDCVDNERVAPARKSNHVRRYRKAQAQGCCGFVDERVTDPEGVEWLIGFNYGH